MKKILCMILAIGLLFGGVYPSDAVFAAQTQSASDADEATPHLNYTKKTLQKGKSVTLKLVGETAKSWKSSDAKIASVTKKGKVTAKKVGKATITCKGKNGKTYKCKITVKKAGNPSELSEKTVYEKMIAMQNEYPEGMPWTNDNYYAWNGGIYSGGYGCAGFAFMLSDAAFGTLPARMHTDFSKIRVGDILRINYDTHSVIVLEVKSDSVIIAEGNYNSSIHWGREIPRSEIEQSGEYVLTRYPEK